MSFTRQVVPVLIAFAVGIVAGGYAFSDSQPRSFLQLDPCHHCLSKRELAGLLVSVGIQKTPALIPEVVFETDKSIAIRNPLEPSAVDYVIFPKRDIRDIGDVTRDDLPYLTDALLVARQIISTQHLRHYRLYTNGPDLQDVRYLHFHVAEHRH